MKFFDLRYPNLVLELSFLKRVSRLAFKVIVKLKITIKDPPKKQYLSRIGKNGGSLIVKLKFTIKDPPKKAIRITYCNSVILLIKCPLHIRKYIVDTSLEFKNSLANNANYRLSIFTNSLSFNILSKIMVDFSIQQYCNVK